jgi:hypothetical protein
MKPGDCFFCYENETVHRLLFDCILAENTWPVIYKYFAVNIGSSLELVARFWVSNNKNTALNTVCAATMWSLRKYRIELVFNGVMCTNIKHAWRRIFITLQWWKILLQELKLKKVESFCSYLPYPWIVVEDEAKLTWWISRCCPRSYEAG